MFWSQRRSRWDWTLATQRLFCGTIQSHKYSNWRKTISSHCLLLSDSSLFCKPAVIFKKVAFWVCGWGQVAISKQFWSSLEINILLIPPSSITHVSLECTCCSCLGMFEQNGDRGLKTLYLTLLSVAGGSLTYKAISLCVIHHRDWCWYHLLSWPLLFGSFGSCRMLQLANTLPQGQKQCHITTEVCQKC